METMKVIWKSCSPYASPITIVEVEKADGTTKIRLCSDVTDLNEATIKDAESIPHQQTVFDRMGGAKWFSNFNLVAGYWQVKIRREDIHKTAFVMPWGQYEYLRMLFRLCNALVTFQRLMNFVLQEHLGEFVMVYLDDIFVYSQTYEEHVQLGMGG